MSLAITRKQEVRAVLKTAAKKRRGSKVRSRKEEVLRAITMRGMFNFKEITVSASNLDAMVQSCDDALVRKYGNPITRDEHGNILICKSVANTIRFFILVKGINEIVPVVNNRSLENAFRQNDIGRTAGSNISKAGNAGVKESFKGMKVVKPIRR